MIFFILTLHKRHDAARKALEELRRKVPDADKRQSSFYNLVPDYIFNVYDHSDNLLFIQLETGLIADVEHNAELKSPISLLHELALKLNQTVDFSVVSLYT